MDAITNYHEAPVVECIRQKLAGTAWEDDNDFIADAACIALNKLPARYVRHIVDTRFFESEEDYKRNTLSIERAVAQALDFLRSREGASPDGSAHLKPEHSESSP